MRIIQKFGFTPLNMVISFTNKGMYKIIYNIPDVLQDKIHIFNIKTDYDNHNKINKNVLIKKIFNSINNDRYVTKNINVIDYLDYKSKYSFGPHTDMEWNVIKNDGYQAWILIKNQNQNNHGNMFIVYNEFLFNKYKNIYYSLFEKNGKIIVAMNCKYSYIKNEILEVFDIDWFIKNTQLFYLDFNDGDCMVFNKHICHMSDIRGNNMRYAINFRVVIDDVKYDNNSCGYVSNKNSVYEQFKK